MAINGIPVTLKNSEGTVENAVFATVKKHPKLLKCLHKIAAADIRETVAARRFRDADALLQTCDPAQLETFAAAATEASEKAQAATQAMFDAITAFTVEGFVGAGYDREEAERFAGLVDVERLAELRAKCMLGTGHVDFTAAVAK